MRMPPLAVQILGGLGLGIVLGIVFFGNAKFEAILTPIGDIFIRLIKMIVVPIVVATLIDGVAGMGNVKRLGGLGLKTLIFFEVVTTFAIVFGIFVANVVKPGAGLDASALPKADISTYATAAQTANHSIVDLLVHVVPTNPIDALAKGDMLAVIFFSVFFGLGVAVLGEKGEPILAFFRTVASAMFWVTNQIMKFAPLGAFALIGITVAKFGVTSLLPLLKLVLTVYGAMIVFVALVFTPIARFVGIKLLALMGVIKEELLLAFSTASSEAVLARIIEKMEAVGCPEYVVGIVVPLGYTFNLIGSTLYQSIAAIFVAQLYGVKLSIGEELLLVATLALTSKGIAGVPGASFVVLLATLGSFGLPLEGLAFIAGIDRVLDMARTAVNVLGNSLAAIVMTRSEGVALGPLEPQNL